MLAVLATPERLLAETAGAELAEICSRVEHSASGEEAARLALRHRADVVVIGAALRDMDAGQVLRLMRRSGVASPLLVLADANASLRARLLDAGADDCLALPYDAGEFLARVRALVRRSGAAATSAGIALGDLRLFPDSMHAEFRGAALRLSASEFKVLEILVASPGRLVAPGVLAGDERVSRRVAEVTVSRLRRKLDEGGARNAIRNVYGQGYMICLPEPAATAGSAGG